ncbi:hypothetical protein ACTXT7_001289 [Hymenolepis weldensis]
MSEKEQKKHKMRIKKLGNALRKKDDNIINPSKKLSTGAVASDMLNHCGGQYLATAIPEDSTPSNITTKDSVINEFEEKLRMNKACDKSPSSPSKKSSDNCSNINQPRVVCFTIKFSSELPTPGIPPKQPSFENKPVYKYAIVKSNFTSGNPDDLTVEVDGKLEIIHKVNDVTFYARNMSTGECGNVFERNISLVESLPRGVSTNSGMTSQSRDSCQSNSSRTDESVESESPAEPTVDPEEFKKHLGNILRHPSRGPINRNGALTLPPDIPLRPEGSKIPLKKGNTLNTPRSATDMTKSWLMIDSIPEGENSANLLFKIGEVVQWLDYDSDYFSNDPRVLEPGKMLECLNWAGESIVIPSSCVRTFTSDFELSQVLSRRPKASVIADFRASTTNELTVKTGEVVYLIKQLDSDNYLAINKSNTRGRVPKDVLNILVAPTCSCTIASMR